MLRTAAVLLALSGTSTAQSFNLDVGANQSHPLPANGYGAAANQPGAWVGVSTTAQSAVPITDIVGANTGVTITPVGGFGDFAVNNPTWMGDDDLLMEDASDVGGIAQGAPGGSVTWTIQGLAAGDYAVYTYALAPDFPASYNTRITVSGAVQGPQVVGGAWSGSPHVLGTSFARHDVAIASGQTLTIVTDDPGTITGNLSTVNGFQLVQGIASVGTAYCFGDGSATACPCGNASAPGAGEGCLNSLGVGGRITAAGSASLSNDTLVLTGSQMPNSSALYFQGTTRQNGGLGVVFGDGLRCAGGSVLRLGTKANAGGTSQYPAAGDLPVSVRGFVTAPGTRTYQCWYRNAAAFCTAATFNLTNGIGLTWTP